MRWQPESTGSSAASIQEMIVRDFLADLIVRAGRINLPEVSWMRVRQQP
jgi:hypothetical protein